MEYLKLCDNQMRLFLDRGISFTLTINNASQTWQQSLLNFINFSNSHISPYSKWTLNREQGMEYFKISNKYVLYMVSLLLKNIKIIKVFGNNV